MTNVEILNNEKLIRNIDEDVHTYAKWKSLGFSVKKGEKALFKTSLWKMVNKKKKGENAEDTEETSGHMYLAVSHLFGRSQVEKLQEESK